MMDDVALAGKPFIVLSTNGDLPNNPMSLRECMVCGEVFTAATMMIRARPSAESVSTFSRKLTKPMFRR